MAGIIWLASYPKSGNTWLRAFLANLMRNPERAIPINDLPNHILGDSHAMHYEQFTGKSIEELGPEEIAQVRPKVHDWFAFSRPDSVFVKTHNAVGIVDGTPLITPSATAGAIYVARNPMDVAVSFAHHYQVSHARAVESLCERNYYLPPSSGQLTQYTGDWSRHVRSWLDAPGLRLHVMRYEDMLQKPLKSFGELIKFLGLPDDPPRLKRAIRFSSFRELSEQEAKDRFSEARPDGKANFFRQGRAGDYRQILTAEQIQTLVEAHREAMTRLGYLTAEGEPTV